jgi:hypothetical protein
MSLSLMQQLLFHLSFIVMASRAPASSPYPLRQRCSLHIHQEVAIIAAILA